MERKDFLEYAEECGNEAAANLLLLCGPDGFNGSYEEYEELEKIFNEKSEAKST